MARRNKRRRKIKTGLLAFGLFFVLLGMIFIFGRKMIVGTISGTSSLMGGFAVIGVIAILFGVVAIFTSIKNSIFG